MFVLFLKWRRLFFSCFQRCFDDSLIILLLWDLRCKISFLSGHKAIKDRQRLTISFQQQQATQSLVPRHRERALPDSNGRLRLRGSWSGSGSRSIYTLLRLRGHGGDYPGWPHRHPPWLRWDIGYKYKSLQSSSCASYTRTLYVIEDSAITTCSRYSWRVLTARGAPLRNNCAKPRTELDKTSRLKSWNIYITTITSVMHIMYIMSILNDKVGFTQSRNLWELQFIAITSFLGNTICFRKVT